ENTRPEPVTAAPAWCDRNPGIAPRKTDRTPRRPARRSVARKRDAQALPPVRSRKTSLPDSPWLVSCPSPCLILNPNIPVGKRFRHGLLGNVVVRQSFVRLDSWMERYQQADPEAPAALVAALSPALLRFFRGQVASREQADDLLQETWL